MAPLPQLPRRLAVTEAARNRVTGDDAAAPFRAEARGRAAMAGAAGAFSEGLNEIDRAAQNKRLAELSPAIEEAIQKAGQEHAGNPELFRKWTDGYLRQVARDHRRDPLVAEALVGVARRFSSRTYMAMSDAVHRQALTGAKAAMVSRAEELDNRMAALARDGGTASEDYAASLNELRGLYGELERQPLYGYDRARIESDLAKMEARHNSLAVVGRVGRLAADRTVDPNGNPLGGPLAAKALADSLLTDTGLNLTPEQRQQYHRLAVSEIRQLSAENRALVSQINVDAREWVKNIEGGEADPDTIRDFLERASDAGAARAASSVMKAAAAQSYLRGWFDKLPAADRARAVLGMEGRLGGDREVDAIVGAESGGDPSARAATSSAAGLGQFVSATWLDLIKRHAPEVAAGRSDEAILALRTDPAHAELNRRMVGVLRDENRAALQQAGVRADSGAVYLAHFLGAPDAIKVLSASPEAPLASLVQQRSIDANRAIFERNPTAKDLIAFAERKVGAVPEAVRNDPAFLNAARKRLREDLRQALPRIEARVKAGETIAADELNDLGAMVYAVGSDDDRKAVVEMALFAELGGRLAGMSAQEREAAGAEFARRFAQGSTQLESEIGGYVSAHSKRIADAYKNDPYDAVVRFGKRAPTPPVDFNNPAGLADALKAREVERGFILEHEGIAPVSLLRPREADALRGALLGMDPARLAGAAGVASNMLARHADAFAGVTGKEKIEQEAVKFRHLVDNLGMTAEGAAAQMIAERTPEHRARMQAKVKGEDVDKVVKDSLRVEDLRSAFDASWSPGSPQIGFTVEGRAGMFSDYAELFRARYAETGDADLSKRLAQDQLKRVWGVSNVNGSDVVMRYPPERAPVMAGIENAPDIVARQAIDAIRAETGQTVDRASLRLVPLPGLTAAAYRGGQPPPYMLGWTDAEGLPHWLPPGRAFVVDVDGARAAQSARREAEFIAGRSALDAMRGAGVTMRPF